jgi:hypothetical protein
MRADLAWHVTATLLMLRLICQSLAALPEDAVFVPGTLPLDDRGKEVICPLHGSLLIYHAQLRRKLMRKGSLS